MLESVLQYWVAGLFLLCFMLSFASRDWRLQGAATILLGAYVLAYVLPYVVGVLLNIKFIPIIVSEILVNIEVMYGLFQLHFKLEGETEDTIWPLYVLGLELLIFISHSLYWIFDYGQYNFTVSIFSMSEVFLVIIISLQRIYRIYFTAQGTRL